MRNSVSASGGRTPSAFPTWDWDSRRARDRLTFILLLLAEVAQDGLQVHVEAVAVAQQLQEMPGARGTARVVDQLPGGRKAIWQDLKLLALWRRSRLRANTLQTANVPLIFKVRFL